MKKYAISTLIVGILFVAIGIVFITTNDNLKNNDINQNNSNNSDNKNDGNNDADNNNDIIIDTSKIDGDEIDNSSYKNYTINKYTENSIYSQNLSLKNIYSFSYESGLEDVVLGNNAIRAKNNNSSVVSFVSNLTDRNIKFQFILNYKNLGFDKLKTYESTETIKIFDLNVKYIKLESARSDLRDKDNYRENFIIIIEEPEDKKIVFSYEIIDSKFTDELLTKIINSIDIEKNKATYLYTKTENGKLIGTLKQNSELEHSNIYQINYELDSSKYKEVENKNNTINFNTLKTKENENIDIFLMTTAYTSNDISTEFVDEVKGRIYESNDKVEFVDANKSSDKKDDKLVYKALITFKNKDGKLLYNLSAAYQIENDIYYVVSINSDKSISDDLLRDFNDINYKKIT